MWHNIAGLETAGKVAMESLTNSAGITKRHYVYFYDLAVKTFLSRLVR